MFSHPDRSPARSPARGSPQNPFEPKHELKITPPKDAAGIQALQAGRAAM